MILQSSNYNCVMYAISVARLSLGYEEPFEPGLPLQYPTDMSYILKYKNRFFPNNKTELYFNNFTVTDLIKRGYISVGSPYFSFDDFFKKKDLEINKFICIFDYLIPGATPMTHTVIGFPTYFNGMTGQYILKIYIDYQLELGI